MKPKLLIVTAVIVVLTTFALKLPAQMIDAATFTLPQSPYGGNLVNGVDGFDFTPTANLTVTALGWYDDNGDGLAHTHPVGIYLTSTQTLVTPSRIVSTSSALDPTNNFRFESIVPFTLSAGVTYTLAGYGEGPAFDPYVENPSGGITFGPGFNFDRARTSRSSGLEFPTTAGGEGLVQDLFFGPNFQYTLAPEPNISCFLCIGFGIAVYVRHRISAKQSV